MIIMRMKMKKCVKLKKVYLILIITRIFLLLLSLGYATSPKHRLLLGAKIPCRLALYGGIECKQTFL